MLLTLLSATKWMASILWRFMGGVVGAGWIAFLGVSLGLGNTWFVILGVLGLGFILVARDRLRSIPQQPAG